MMNDTQDAAPAERGEMRVLPLPTEPHEEWPAIRLPCVMSAEEFDRIIELLMVMKPALTGRP